MSQEYVLPWSYLHVVLQVMGRYYFEGFTKQVLMIRPAITASHHRLRRMKCTI